MTDRTGSGSDTKGTRKPKQRRKTVSIGGTSQSAFAGYATTGKSPKKRKSAAARNKTDTEAADAANDEQAQD